MSKIHDWDVSPKNAIEIQNHIREQVRLIPLGKNIRTIAGADVSLNRFSHTLYAGIIVLSYPDLRVIDHACVMMETNFPYIPGLLSFREIPGLLKCWEKLETKPDVVMVDGQGIAHPRRLGIAAHFGVLIDTPTVGCAKSILTGVHESVERAGASTPLLDRKTGEPIGVVLKSKDRSNPLIISPGHLMTIKDSLEIVKTCLRGYRLPEPTRLAHELVNRFRRGEMS